MLEVNNDSKIADLLNSFEKFASNKEKWRKWIWTIKK